NQEIVQLASMVEVARSGRPAIPGRLEICTFRHNIKPMTGRTTKMMAMNERNTERQRSALDRIEGVCVRLASSTNVEALRRGLAAIHLLIATKHHQADAPPG